MAISIIIGVVIAGVYHYLSLYVQKLSSQKKPSTASLITVASFLVRIAVLFGLLIALGLWTSLNIIAVCIAFIALFTILNGIWMYATLKKRNSLSLEGPRKHAIGDQDGG